jgi:serine/threonine protein kinase
MKDPKDNDAANKGRPGNKASDSANAHSDKTLFKKSDHTRIDNRQGSKADFGQSAAPPDQTRVNSAGGRAAVDPTRIKQTATQNNGNAGNYSSSPQLRVLKERFILEKVLGVGGMGVVYKAKDRHKVEAHDRDPYVAIKVLSEEFKAHPESFIALQRESRKGQRIAHPNVVKVYDFDRDGDIVFMTMEYLEGKPLDQLIKQYSTTGLPRNDVWAILDGICPALIQAHNENIVHSDFKPGNIFITNEGKAKIFDFGIARAVAGIDRAGSTNDKTVFDAGTLGALTPAYASREMLRGKKPDVRDDIYALGCIAYEMLTGEHPFNRMPADEAFNRKLKPKRITDIKKQQWKAIEKALSFRREDRVATVDEFYKLILPQAKSSYIVAALIVLVALLAIIGYLVLSPGGSVRQTPPSTVDLGEIEFKIKYDLYKKKIEKLLLDNSFSPQWENDMWEEIKSITELLSNRPDEWLLSTRSTVYGMYMNKIKELSDKKEYSKAALLVDNAYRYTADPIALNAEKEKLAELMKLLHIKTATDAQDKSATDKQRQDLATQKIKIKTDFDLALKNVNQQLECRSRLNMRDLGIAIEKLRSLDMQGYKKLEDSFIVQLAECITDIAKTNPDSALESKNSALKIFGGNTLLASIKITPRDACDTSIAGLGGRGDRAVCKDKTQGIGNGPTLVVVPAEGNLHAFAIGKYEVSIKELNQYCAATKDCEKLPGEDDNLPATNISISTMSGYLKWLSKTTLQRYRLPTKTEWLYAATGNTTSHDPNRNCQLSSRGLQKGGQFVRVNAGMQNGWGMVNYLGNAQEVVSDKDMSYLAMGGTYEDSMDECDVKTVRKYSGAAEPLTGFRILREIPKK